MKTCSQHTYLSQNPDIRENVMLKPYTSLKIGGPADYFAQPVCVSQLQQMIQMAGQNGIPCTVMGSGTNLLIKDRGIRGLVVSLVKIKKEIEITPGITSMGTASPERTSMETISGNGNEFLVTASAGTILATLCRKTIEHGLEDLSFTAGIPGTVGGAVMMNAGTGTSTMADHLYSIDILDHSGTIQTLGRSQLIFSHRKLEFPSLPDEKTPVILSTSFLLKKGNRATIKASWQTLMDKRKASQPHGLASAGCFFKNPATGKSAGELIDKAGLKNRRIGDAMVSGIHANFIVNLGNATAHDILTLHDIIKQTVKEQFDTNLSAEVVIKGE